MKCGASRSPKVRRLARRLETTTRDAVGLLNMLWEFAAEQAPRGDVGRWDDVDIADAVDWPEDRAAELVAALVACRWLDECVDHRLVVHDWADHCPEYIRKRLSRRDLEPAAPNGGQRLPNGGQRLPVQGGQGQGGGREGNAPRAREEPPPDESPHPPQEPEPPTHRSLADPVAAAERAFVAEWSKRHGREPSWPSRENSALRTGFSKAHRAGPKQLALTLAAIGAYLDHDHESVAGHPPSRFFARLDEWIDRYERKRAGPKPKPGREPPPELAIGRRPGDGYPCRCGHGQYVHRDGERCDKCPCSEYTPAESREEVS